MSDAALREGFDALRRDLLDAEGPRISTMRSYRFAILQYQPSLEYPLRAETQRLTNDLINAGWAVLPISLQKLLLDRIRKQGPAFSTRIVAMERAKALRTDSDAALDYLRTKLEPLIEGEAGLAADVQATIARWVDAYPERADRTLVVIGRLGALYPFFRASALLRHLDGKTRNVPVVVLYPGTRSTVVGPGGTGTALSFMGVMPPDSDYRPRIYP